MEIRSKTVVYRTEDDEISGHLARPANDGKYPAVILIHEIFGLDPHIKGVADRLAAEGYVVLAPHLFSSKKLSQILTPEAIGETLRFMMTIPPEKQRDEAYRKAELAKLDEKTRNGVMGVYTMLFVNRPVDLFTEYLSSGVDCLNSLENVNGRVGSVGFCFGGGMSINLACTGKTDASVIFYGENPDPVDKVKNVKGAVMGIYAGEDQRINSKINELVSALVEHKKAFSIKVYPGVHHGFFNDTRKNTYSENAATDAWEQVLDLFTEMLW